MMLSLMTPTSTSTPTFDRTLLYQDLASMVDIRTVTDYLYQPSYHAMQMVMDDMINQAYDHVAKMSWVKKLSPNRQLALVWSYLFRPMPTSAIYDLERGCWECAAQGLREDHYPTRIIALID